MKKFGSAAKFNIEHNENQYFQTMKKKRCFKCSICPVQKQTLTIQEKVEKLYFVEKFTQERRNTNSRRLKLIADVTIFAALLKNIPMGCPDFVLPNLL